MTEPRLLPGRRLPPHRSRRRARRGSGRAKRLRGERASDGLLGVFLLGIFGVSLQPSRDVAHRARELIYVAALEQKLRKPNQQPCDDVAAALSVGLRDRNPVDIDCRVDEDLVMRSSYRLKQQHPGHHVRYCARARTRSPIRRLCPESLMLHQGCDRGLNGSEELVSVPLTSRRILALLLVTPDLLRKSERLASNRVRSECGQHRARTDDDSADSSETRHNQIPQHVIQRIAHSETLPITEPHGERSDRQGMTTPRLRTDSSDGG